MAAKTAKGGLITKPGAALAKKETNIAAGAKKRSALGDVSNVQAQVSSHFLMSLQRYIYDAFRPDSSDISIVEKA